MTTPPEHPGGTPSTGDPGGGDGTSKPSTANQAKYDLLESAGTIAVNTAKGAATGGWVGAGVGALKGVGTAAVQTKTGRKALITAALVPIIAMVLVFTLFSITSAPTSISAGHASMAQEAAGEDIDNDKKMTTIQNAAAQTGVKWEVLAAISQVAGGRQLEDGTGPFGIDMDEAGGEISEAEAQDLSKAAHYIGDKLGESSNDTVGSLPNQALDAGAVDVRGIDGEEHTRRISEREQSQKLQAEVRDQYIAAISELPIAGNPDIADTIYDTAHTWSLGLNQQCKADNGGDVVLGGQTSVDLNQSQLKYAQQIINVVAGRNMPQQAAVIALATAMQESTLRMWWNVKVPGSKELTDDKDAMGSDGYSVGLFQQQVHGNDYSWGTVEDAMDPVTSTNNFLDRLQTIQGWQDMEMSAAAQAVQVSAFPDAYAKWEAQARQLVSDLEPTGDGGYSNPHEHADEEAEGDDGSGGGTESNGNGDHLEVNSTVTPDLQAVEMAVKDLFGQWVSSMGDYRPNADSHTEKRAVDLMIPDYKSAESIAGGDKIAKFFIDNAKSFGVEYIIWRDRIWLGPSFGWKDYSGGGYGSMYAGNWNDTTLHMDHVHITVYGNKGTGGDYTYDGGGATGDCATGGLHGIAVGGSGEGDDYPYATDPGRCAWCDGIDPGDADPWSLYKRECVSFVAWRMNQQMGWDKGEPYPFTPAKLGLGFFGNAEQWSSQLAKAGYVTDDNPTPGSIAWWDSYGGTGIGQAGHVAVVQKVHGDGTITIEQYNAWPEEWAYSTQRMPASDVTGFIHVADTKK